MPGLLAALLMTVAAGPLFNHTLAAAGPSLRASLDISRGEYGILATVLFAAAAWSSSFIGRVSARWTYRTQLLVNFGGAALAFAIAAAGPHYALLVVAAAIGGFAQAISNPTTNRAVYDFVPARARPRWVGVKQSGVQVSQLIAGLLIPVALLAWGWTPAALAAAGVVIAALLWSLRRLPAHSAAPPPAAPAAAAAARRRVSPGVRLLAAGAFLAGAGTQATNLYLVLFAHESLGQSVVVGGWALALTGLLGIVSRLAWSIPVGRGVPSWVVLLAVAIGSFLTALCLTAAAGIGGLVFFWMGVVLHGACALSINVVIFNAVFALSDGPGIAASTGVVSVGMYAGFALGPVVVGAVADVAGDFTAGWIVVAAMYALFVVVSVVVAHLGRRQDGGARRA